MRIYNRIEPVRAIKKTFSLKMAFNCRSEGEADICQANMGEGKVLQQQIHEEAQRRQRVCHVLESEQVAGVQEGCRLGMEWTLMQNEMVGKV